MTKSEIAEQFITIIQDASALVEDDYFRLPVAGLDTPRQFERNYCYELHRYIRNLMPNDMTYKINAEVDKSAHPIIKKIFKGTPDFIIHHSEKMGIDDNLIIMEVKSSKGDLAGGIEKDIESIERMTSMPNGYFRGIIYIFGEMNQQKQERLTNRLRELIKPNVIVLFHKEIGQKAERVLN